jgi:hypothetical protein
VFFSIDAFVRKKEGDYIHKFHLEDREGVERVVASWSRSGDVLFFRLLSTFPLSNDKNS